MDDIKNQSHEEWNKACFGDEFEPKPKPPEYYFRYLDHRTTKHGSVVLEFQSLCHKVTAVKFFNVSLQGKTKKYPAGSRGQFNPPPKGEFRKFWLQAVGKDPDRWARIHKSMRSHLSSLVFVGDIDRALDGKGNLYFKFKEISAAGGHEMGTERAQNGHGLGTNWTPF